MHSRKALFTLFASAALPISGALADVTISADPTANMECAAGVCGPTAVDAVLNVTELENLLASGNVSIVTTTGSIQAKNIGITAPFSWSAANSLELDAYQSLSFSAVVRNLSEGNVALTTNDGGAGGTLTFTIGAGKLDTNKLSINGVDYSMVGSIRRLVRRINNNPNGHIALSTDIDASKAGTFDNSPVLALGSTGVLNGLGHTIEKLKIIETVRHGPVGLLRHNEGTVVNLMIADAEVVVDAIDTGAVLVGENDGKVSNCSPSGMVSTVGIYGGGLVGDNYGTITISRSSAAVQSSRAGAGGLVGTNTGTISQSFATGDILGQDGNGGLVAYNGGGIADSYALGNISAEKHHKQISLGGFAGFNDLGASVVTSYSMGSVAGDGPGEIGGFTGADGGAISNSYWDTKTSGTDQGSGDGKETGRTGLTTQQFKAGLPAGLDPSIWAEDPAINNGFPYLIANSPAK